MDENGKSFLDEAARDTNELKIIGGLPSLLRSKLKFSQRTLTATERSLVIAVKWGPVT